MNWKFTAAILAVLMIPVCIFCIFNFYNMKQNAVEKSIEYMQSAMNKECQTIKDNVEAVNMTALVVTEDKRLRQLLQKIAADEEIPTQELRQFYEENIGYLQRIINSNPDLYAVRIYDCRDSVKEMVPVLYRASRMKGQGWGNEESPKGWYFGFRDSIFQVEANAPEIVSMVTEVKDYIYGKIATVEIVIRVDKMFPGIYDETDDYYGCFIDQWGQAHQSGEMNERDTQQAQKLRSGRASGEEIQISYEENGGRKMIAGTAYLKGIDGTMVLFCDISDEIRNVQMQAYQFAAILFLLVVILSLTINQIVKFLLKRVYEIIENVRQAQEGTETVPVKGWGGDEIGELGNQVSAMVEEIKRLIRENYQKDILTKNAQLKALHNQINAHFLYNVLGAINMLAEMDGEEVISNAVIALGDMMHYSLKWDSEEVELRKEIKYIRDYLSLINIRYDNQILLDVDVPEPMMDLMIPKMILQPIIENSVKHGLRGFRCDTVIEVRGIQKGGIPYIEIIDYGKGIAPKELEILRGKIKGELVTGETENGHGVAMRNIQERMIITYGAEAGLEIESELGKYTKVKIRMSERALS